MCHLHLYVQHPSKNTLLPLLVDGDRVEEADQRLLQSMILMEPPVSSQRFGFAMAPPTGQPQQPLAETVATENSAAQNRFASGNETTLASAAVNTSDNRALYYGPAAAANFRTNLLRSGDPGEEVMRRVSMPVLLITSARDRLLPSIAEGESVVSSAPM